MADRSINNPGRDRPITIEPNRRRIVITGGDDVSTDTRGALTLREASYSAVQHIPRKDADKTA